MLSQEFPSDPGALFSDIRLGESGPVVAAVSGGGDSLALLLLLHDYLRHLPRAPSLLAVTIDHGLRPESAEEALAVGRLAAGHGIAHRILRWEGEKPAAGISAAAREARMALLAQAAREAGSGLVLTAHTADDQAETLSMRLARGEGRGIAGMAPATLYDGEIWFVRPLLEVRRAALRVFLKERGVAWFEDPTNKDRRFERVRVREALDGRAIRELINTAREARSTRERSGRSAAHLIGQAGRKVAPGLIRLPVEQLRRSEAGIYTLRILLAVAGGTPHLPDEARVRSILARAAEEGFRASLSRAVMATRRGHLYLHRERRNLPDMPLVEDLIWDGRYRITARGAEKELRIAPFGRELSEEADIGSANAPAGLLRAALEAEPAVWKGRRCLGLAGEVEEAVLRPVAGPWARFLPSFDLAPADAVASLLGDRPVPMRPFHRHKEHIG